MYRAVSAKAHGTVKCFSASGDTQIPWQKSGSETVLNSTEQLWSHKRNVACRIRGTTHQAHSFDEHKKLLHLGP